MKACMEMCGTEVGMLCYYAFTILSFLVIFFDYKIVAVALHFHAYI